LGALIFLGALMMWLPGERPRTPFFANFRVADEPLAIRKRYGVTEEISLSLLRARQASGLLV